MGTKSAMKTNSLRGWMSDLKNKTKIAPIDPPRKLLQGPLGNTIYEPGGKIRKRYTKNRSRRSSA